MGATISEEELSALFMVADISGQGVIDYEEFIAAMLDSQRVAQRLDAVRSSFEQLDRDGDGYISVQDLAQVGMIFRNPVLTLAFWEPAFGSDAVKIRPIAQHLCRNSIPTPSAPPSLLAT